MRGTAGWAAACVLLAAPGAARAQTVADLQRQIDELKAELQAMRAARAPTATAQAPTAQAATAQAAPAAAPAQQTAQAQPPAAGQSAAAQPQQIAVADTGHKKPWYERLRLRGYTQVRWNHFLSGDDTAPAGRSRLRSVHDSSITDKSNFTLRRARLVLQGDISDRVQLYFQTDFASAVSGQSNGESRLHYGQLRDAYADVFLDKAKEFKLRFGQSKVPFGWENLQSSSNRLTLDRSDGINSATISERDLGVVAYYTPHHVDEIWKRLEHDGQKLFGNYGAFAAAVYNGQGINRTETNGNVMKMVMATWPFEIGDTQVLEVGAAGYLNKFNPEVRSGGTSAIAYDDKRVGAHLILYPQPIGIQAEWNWGKGPEYDLAARAIRTKKLNGGYVQAMYRVPEFGVGKVMPYARWQRYRGGWKSSTNAPRLETNEVEAGVEWQFFDAMELTVAYAHMKRREADERRQGRATGDLIRTQVQFNY